MKFDEKNVFTILNADKAKVGMVGWFANSISELKLEVEKEKDTYALNYILNENYTKRFISYGTTNSEKFNLFYEDTRLNPKYCPFCNSTSISAFNTTLASEPANYIVSCNQCEVRTRGFPTLSGALDAWNNRK